MDNAKKNKKGLFVAGGIAVVAVFAAIFLIAIVVAIIVVVNVSKGPRIDLTKYIVFEATGYDGYGETSATIDWDSIEEKYGEKIKYSKKASEWGVNSYDYDSPVDVLKEDVEITLDKQDKVANGDEINYEISINEEYNKYLKCKIKTGDGTYIVEGLEKIDTFNPFDYVTVEFSGISPSGEVKAYYNGEKEGFSQSKFVLDKKDGLKNGDTVKISVDIDDSETVKYGYIIPEKEKIYTVEGLEEYVSEYSDLSQENLDELRSEAEDIIWSYSGSNIGYELTADITYVGYAFWNVQKPSWGYRYNYLCIMYSGSAAYKGETYDMTFPVIFYDIVNSEEGLSYSVGKEINEMAGDICFFGYVNPATCYSDMASRDTENYDVEVGDGFEKYGKYEAIENINDITSEYREQIHSDAEDSVKSYYSNTLGQNYDNSKIEYIGEGVLIQKNQGSKNADINKYIVVYSFEFYRKGKSYKTYCAIEYKGILYNGEKYIVLGKNDIAGYRSLDYSFVSIRGYETPEEMFNKLFTARRDDYKYDISEGLKQYEK